MSRVSRRSLLRSLIPGKSMPEGERPAGSRLDDDDHEDDFFEDVEPRFVVRIDDNRCLPYKGPECGACMNLCEIGDNEAQALRLRRFRPYFAADSCNGCELCIKACPVIPKALEISPYESRQDL